MKYSLILPGFTNLPPTRTKWLTLLLLKGPLKSLCLGGSCTVAGSLWLHLLANFEGVSNLPCVHLLQGKVIDKNLEIIFGLTFLFCEQRVAYLGSYQHKSSILPSVLPSDKELELSVKCFSLHKAFFSLRKDKCACISCYFRIAFYTLKRGPLIHFRVKNSFLLDDSYQQSCSCWEKGEGEGVEKITLSIAQRTTL